MVIFNLLVFYTITNNDIQSKHTKILRLRIVIRSKRSGILLMYLTHPLD